MIESFFLKEYFQNRINNHNFCLRLKFAHFIFFIVAIFLSIIMFLFKKRN